MMQSRFAGVVTTVLGVVALLVMSTAPAMAQLPEGVSVKVLAEWPSEIPGVAKIRHLELRMEQGAKWENLEITKTDL